MSRKWLILWTLVVLQLVWWLLSEQPVYLGVEFHGHRWEFIAWDHGADVEMIVDNEDGRVWGYGPSDWIK